MRVGRYKVNIMKPEDERQYMLNDRFEIMEKFGVPTGAMQLHFHNFYELLYIAEGEFACIVEDASYYLKKGDFFLIDINQMHHYQYVENRHESTRRILLWITKEYLEELSGPRVDLTGCFHTEGASAYHFPAHHEDRLSGFLFQILFGASDSDGPDAEQMLIEKAYLTLFFVYLNRLCTRRSFRLEKEEKSANIMIKTALEYIEQNLHHTVTAEELAALTGMSRYLFLRSFREETGMTLHDFVIKRRLAWACAEIRQGCPIRDACRKCGFSDYSSFFRNFRKVYDMSPREYKLFTERQE